MCHKVNSFCPTNFSCRSKPRSKHFLPLMICWLILTNLYWLTSMRPGMFFPTYLYFYFLIVFIFCLRRIRGWVEVWIYSITWNDNVQITSLESCISFCILKFVKLRLSVSKTLFVMEVVKFHPIGYWLWWGNSGIACSEWPLGLKILSRTI